MKSYQLFFATAGIISISTLFLGLATSEAKDRIKEELSSVPVVCEATEMNSVVSETLTDTDVTTTTSISKNTAFQGHTNANNTTNVTEKKLNYMPFYNVKNHVLKQSAYSSISKKLDTKNPCSIFDIEDNDIDNASIDYDEIAKIDYNEMDNNKINDIYYGNAMFSYRGHIVNVKDIMLKKAKRIKNGKIAMDFIIDTLQPELLDSLHINSKNYTISMQRQTQLPDDNIYGIHFEKNEDKIFISILFDVENKSIVAYSLDGLIAETKHSQETASNDYPFNWSDRKKRKVYEEYLSKAKEKIENDLNLPAIVEETVDISDSDYFHCSEGALTVGFGYQLENGMFIHLIYNVETMEWDGLVVLGYDKDLLVNSTINQTKEGEAILKKYGVYKFYKERKKDIK